VPTRDRARQEELPEMAASSRRVMFAIGDTRDWPARKMAARGVTSMGHAQLRAARPLRGACVTDA